MTVYTEEGEEGKEGKWQRDQEDAATVEQQSDADDDDDESSEDESSDDETDSDVDYTTDSSRRRRGSTTSESESDDGSSESGSARRAAEKAASKVKVKTPLTQAQAATLIQGMYRSRQAKKQFISQVRQVYEKQYDAENGEYFFYNKLSGESQWEPPATLRGEEYEPRETAAVCRVQRMFRRKRAHKKLMAMLDNVYEKGYDKATDSWYYYNKISGATEWHKPKLYGDREPPTNPSDAAVQEKDVEIAKLRAMLAEKEAEAMQAKQSLVEEQTKIAVREGALDEDDAKKRSKHMDAWGVDHVAEWFDSLGYGQYSAGVRSNRVDGLLLLHMMGEDWVHLGIKNALHVRRIDVAMQKYRLRFEHAQNGGGNDSESDGFSDMSASDTPSELLDEEEAFLNEEEERREHGDNSDSHSQPPTEDELAAMRQDDLNIKKQVIFEGDGEEKPLPGDVVKIHYTCAIAHEEDWTRPASEKMPDKIVESSRKMRRRALEFVLGEGQVVRGLDRAIPSMTFGERAKFTITAEYAYGAKGFPPIIPPESSLVFDVNLVRFIERPRWVKKLLQHSGPYLETPYEPEQKKDPHDSTATDPRHTESLLTLDQDRVQYPFGERKTDSRG